MKKFAMMLALALPMVFASCGDDDPTSSFGLDKSNASVDYGKTIELKADVKNVEWSSSDNFVATVDSKGKVTAKHAGTCTITATKDGEKASCKVTVNATNNNFVLPVLNFGITKSQLKKQVPSDLVFVSDEDGVLMYTGANEAYPWYAYVYENGKDALAGSMLAVDMEMDEANDLEGFLDQRYQYYQEQDNQFLYGDGETMSEANVAVVYGYNAELDLVTATFVPMEHTKAGGIGTSVYNAAFNAVRAHKK